MDQFRMNKLLKVWKSNKNKGFRVFVWILGQEFKNMTANSANCYEYNKSK